MICIPICSRNIQRTCHRTRARCSTVSEHPASVLASHSTRSRRLRVVSDYCESRMIILRHSSVWSAPSYSPLYGQLSSKVLLHRFILSLAPELEIWSSASNLHHFICKNAEQWFVRNASRPLDMFNRDASARVHRPSYIMHVKLYPWHNRLEIPQAADSYSACQHHPISHDLSSPGFGINYVVWNTAHCKRTRGASVGE